MGYNLESFIGKLEDLEKFKEKFSNAMTIQLNEKVALLPMTRTLFNDINNYRTNNKINKFMFLTTDVEREILEIIDNRMISYVELDYFGGGGEQTGIIWKEGKRIFERNFEHGVINDILNKFGIVGSTFKDEFDTVGLGRHRSTEDWIKASDIQTN